MKRALRTTTVALGAAAIGLGASAAEAQIKRPGAHTKYFVELEPHFLLQWDEEPFGGDEGIGLGLRATIPFIDNGPIRTINNNMGIGFGLDWAHFDDPCFFRAFDRRFFVRDFDCTANVFWLPAVVQWNFFLTPAISVFGEAGLGIEHARVSYEFWCNTPGGRICDLDDSDTDVEFLIFGGARFMVSDHIGFLVRLGRPYLSLGASFLL